MNVFDVATALRAAAPRETAWAWALVIAVTPSATPIPGIPTATVNASWTTAPERSVPVTVIVAVPRVCPTVSRSLPAASTTTEAIVGSELTTAIPTAVWGEATTVAVLSIRSRSRMLASTRPTVLLTGTVANGPPPSTRGSLA